MRLASVSSASSSSSSDSESSNAPIINGLEAIRQAYSKTDSMCSELSLAPKLASVKLMDDEDTCPEPSKKALTKSKPPKTNGGRVQKKKKTPVINSPKGKMVRDHF